MTLRLVVVEAPGHAVRVGEGHRARGAGGAGVRTGGRLQVQRGVTPQRRGPQVTGHRLPLALPFAPVVDTAGLAVAEVLVEEGAQRLLLFARRQLQDEGLYGQRGGSLVPTEAHHPRR